MNGFLVENGGMQSSIQDAGRVGVSDIGLTQSGAMDEYAFGYANLLLGNPFNTSVIEIALGGMILRARGNFSIALCGASMPCSLNGESIEMWQTYTLKEDDILSFGFATSGNFAYIAVMGGFLTPLAYGSFSTSIKEGLGGVEGRKLLKGDFLACESRVLKNKRKVENPWLPIYAKEVVLRVVLGYQSDLFSKAQHDTFFNTPYMYKGEGDRMGYRLSGEKIIPKATGILSEPICFGAVQIPSHGEPIVLLKERQTIGGYPKIGSVLCVDCFKLAQLRAGGVVKFEVIGLEEAGAKARAFYRFFLSSKLS